MAYKLHIMASVPEGDLKNILMSPILLGVFDSEETARQVWETQPPEYRGIDAATVRTYKELRFDHRTELPPYVYLWAVYHVMRPASRRQPMFSLIPLSCFDSYEDYRTHMALLADRQTMSQCDFLKKYDVVLYASNEHILEKIEINRPVRIPVVLTEQPHQADGSPLNVP